MLTDFFQFLVNGLSIGSLYALIAVGYSMVFGVLKFVNFAHGEIYMIGSYFVMSFALLHIPLYLSLPLGMLTTAIFSVLINRYIYQPLQNKDRLIILISAVCVSIFLQNIVQVIYSPDALSYPYSLPTDIYILNNDIVIRIMDIYIVLIMMIVTTLTWLFIRKTKIGLGIRAIASNSEASKIIGIPRKNLIAVTFFLGGLLATLAGALQGMSTNQIMPLMGVGAGLKAFAAAVLGGIGSIWGSVFGGIIIGISESILIGYGYSLWKDSLSFVFLILFLLFRPQGLFGQKQIIKV
jgi:branched-chain amino acid transport system permease protein